MVSLATPSSKTPALCTVLWFTTWVTPNIKFAEEQFQTGGAVGVSSMQTLEPFKRRLDAGIGTSVDSRLLAAVDWDDVGNGAGVGQVGLGGEYKLYGNTALRAWAITR